MTTGTHAPFSTTRAPHHMVASADGLATQAGLAMLAAGGNAVDAAIATNAAIAVTGPHLCGMGGDLFALVHDGGIGTVHCLNSSGRAGGDASAAALRADGFTEMPFRHDIRTVTIPGCVDGWVTLYERFGSLPMATLLAPAIALAEDGFPASPLLVGSIGRLDAKARESLHELASQARRPGDRVRRPGVARALRGIAEHGRSAFYEGAFGEGLLQLGAGWYTADDLARSQAEWVEPLQATAWGVDLWTVPPNSQGYLTLGAALLADNLELPVDPHDEHWAHLLIEAAKVAGHDRPDVLHAAADGPALLRSIAGRAHQLDTEIAGEWPFPTRSGDTTYLCTTDRNGMGVSLIQSNASGFGSWLVEPNTQINLHNRGLGFNLSEGHPAELTPGTRPPHTLSPALATSDGELAAVFGTMGGDAQPQILLQLAARLFHHEQSPAMAMHAGRWALSGPVTGFDTWTAETGPIVEIEGHAPAEWAAALTARGHTVSVRPPYDSDFGHAQVIMRDHHGFWAGAADPVHASAPWPVAEMSLLITDALLPDGTRTSVRIADGVVVAHGVAAEPGDTIVEGGGRLLLPAMAEAHAHLDKAFLAETVPNPTGDLMGAIINIEAARDRITVADTAARAERAARLISANGATAIRTHADLTTAGGLTSITALLQVRDLLRDLVAIEVFALSGSPTIGNDGATQRSLVAEAVAMGIDGIGGCPHLEPDPEAANEMFLTLAAEAGLPLDLHTDETLDPTRFALADLARRVNASGFALPVTASHCVSLSMQSEAVQQQVAEQVAAAGIHVIALPSSNLFLQGRDHQQAMPRGLTAVKALRAAGANVAAGADNLQDPFNPVGRGDCLETAGLMIMAGHVLPADAYDMVSGNVRQLMGRPAAGPAIGQVADLVLVPAVTVREAIAFGPSGRTVIRAGRVVHG